MEVRNTLQLLARIKTVVSVFAASVLDIRLRYASLAQILRIPRSGRRHLRKQTTAWRWSKTTKTPKRSYYTSCSHYNGDRYRSRRFSDASVNLHEETGQDQIRSRMSQLIWLSEPTPERWWSQLGVLWSRSKNKTGKQMQGLSWRSLHQYSWAVIGSNNCYLQPNGSIYYVRNLQSTIGEFQEIFKDGVGVLQNMASISIEPNSKPVFFEHRTIPQAQ